MGELRVDLDKLRKRVDKFDGDPDEKYETHYIDKSSGGQREIEEPDDDLKRVQKFLSNNFVQSIKPHYNAVGFIKDSSVVDAAKQHCGYPLVMRVDIESFFHSTTRDMIDEKLDRYLSYRTVNNLKRSGHYERILDILTKDDRLAMGAPSSPPLTNVVCKSLDAALTTHINSIEEADKEFVGGTELNRYKYNYTRYADDMVFSTSNKDGQTILPSVRKIIESQGYELNEDKTLIMRGNQRQTVLGMTVNKKPNIPRDKRRQFRARLHNLKMKLKNGEDPIDEETNRRLDYSLIQELAGHIAHAKSINETYADRWENKLEQIKQLAEKREYINL